MIEAHRQPKGGEHIPPFAYESHRGITMRAGVRNIAAIALINLVLAVSVGAFLLAWVLWGEERSAGVGAPATEPFTEV